MLLFYCFVMSIFGFEILNFFAHNSLTVHGLAIIPIFSLAVFIVYLIKTSTSRFIGFVFEKTKLTEEYIHNIQASYVTLGVLIYPVVVMVPFLGANLLSELYIIVLGVLIYVLTFIQRLLRATYISMHQNISFFYIFLYLCALEILPLALLFKVVYDVCKIL
jgi:hypothetical protein